MAIPFRDRVLARVRVDAATGCWLWTGCIGTGGYGEIRRPKEEGRTKAYVHRVMYELFVGLIPAGLVIDHLCRVRACCNPEHLEPVTLQENIARGDRRKGFADGRSHCAGGHELTPGNTYSYEYTYGRQRRCRTCQLAAVRRRKAPLASASDNLTPPQEASA